jgi:hypothetical protein
MAQLEEETVGDVHLFNMNVVVWILIKMSSFSFIVRCIQY